MRFKSGIHGGGVRPCAPRDKGKKWTVGDVVEAFDVHCWRVGEVAKMLSNGCLVVKLFGFDELREFHESDLRVQQAWHDNKRSMIQKSGKTRRIRNSSSQSKSLVVQAPLEPTCSKACYGRNHGKSGLTARTIKQGRASEDPAIGLNLKKRRLISTVEGRIRRAARAPPPPDQQVQCCSVPHTSADIKDIDQCSVASCSINASDGSDAESSLPLELDIHELELQAYNSTLQALYASGPLSWEQEVLLTDLRSSLHISNEEHLYQLRQLLSAADI